MTWTFVTSGKASIGSRVQPIQPAIHSSSVAAMTNQRCRRRKVK
jgi:hypothetical protein